MSDPSVRNPPSQIHDPSLRAADPDRSAWVAANAGAGKTHTLANRVTRLLFAEARPERILCLTYTKAAAAEMQDRLFRQLGQWAMLPDTELKQKIAEVGATASTSSDLAQARRLFAQALETPGGLKIQTIHAFCQNLLARFPIEAGVPPSFRVLDDRTARDLLAEARARVLERAGTGDAALAAAVAHLVTQTSEGRMQQLLDAALSTDRRKLDRFFGHADALTGRLRVAHGAAATDTPRGVAERFVVLAETMPLAEIAAWLATGSKTDIERGQELADALAASDALSRFALFRDVVLTQSGERRARLATAALAKARPDLLAALEGFCSEFLSAEQCHRAAQAAALAEAMLIVADAVRDIYASMKRARGVLDYDDLIAETLKLLERGDAAQWVLFKLDGGLDHILIDEAQDTSPEQWAIVRKLTEEFFAGAGSHEGTRTVFAVGDEKQSIFSFQGAEPKQFDVNRVYFKARADAARHDFADERLQTSRRSAPEILRFVDEVFSTPEASAGLTSQNEPIHHTPLRESAKGRVEVWPPIKPSEAPEPDVWRPVDVESRTSPVVRLATKIADKIKRWTDGSTRLPGRDEAIAPGDIMILLPRREPFGSEVIRRLKERGIAVAGADRIRLTEQIAVMDLIALGRFVLLPEDDLNLAALLRSPMIGMSEEELFELAHGREGRLWSALTRQGGASHDFLADMRGRADYMPPFEFYAHALGPRGMRMKLLARLGHEAGDAIDEFLSHALAHESQNTPSLEGFLHWVERGGAEVKRDMERGRNEVRVMTVHGAKGLEAEIVILADTTTLPEPPGKKGHLLYSGDAALFPVADDIAPDAVKRAKTEASEETLKEHRRLLYVALTRAKDRLYVAGFENKRGTREGSWYALCARAAQAVGTQVERDGETVRVLGDLTDEAAEPRLPFEAPPLTLKPWLDRPVAKERADPRMIQPSEASGEDEPAPSRRPATRFRRGQLVHTLLARLPEIPEEKREAMALRFLKARGVEDGEQLARETLRVLNDPRFAAAFARGSRAEVGLTAKLPELGPTARVNGRIDRLAITENEVLIVDYKTNRPPPASEAELARLYKTQMALYRAAAAKVFKGKRIACALVWTEGPSLMPLSDGLLDAEMSRIAARISSESGED
ncbi:MAG: double-strand break repair helicase AddA [Alphaproteobacteria bacterium]|nr:double-strand break repair helicase AddA [Alphaproteobacteria bacterium]